MNYQQASELYKKQFYSGRKKGTENKNYGFPFGRRYFDDEFILVDILIDKLKIRIRCPELIEPYSDSLEVLPPIWVSFGTKLKDLEVIPYYDLSMKIIDGNHRAYSHKQVKRNTIKAYIPKSHYDLGVQQEWLMC